jgi:hypothetical protein
MQDVDALAPHQRGDADEEGKIPLAIFMEGDDFMPFTAQLVTYNVFLLETPDSGLISLWGHTPDETGNDMGDTFDTHLRGQMGNAYAMGAWAFHKVMYFRSDGPKQRVTPSGRRHQSRLKSALSGACCLLPPGKDWSSGMVYQNSGTSTAPHWRLKR